MSRLSAVRMRSQNLNIHISFEREQKLSQREQKLSPQDDLRFTSVCDVAGDRDGRDEMHLDVAGDRYALKSECLA